MDQVEIASIRRDFEGLRLKNDPYERILLESLRLQGVHQPLRGLLRREEGAFVLLDGFKRLRCLLRLGIPSVPVESIGLDLTGAVSELLFQSSEKSLNILEQAAFCDYLNKHRNLGVLKIAGLLKKSPAWVSLRLGILDRMSPKVRQELFEGRFPARSYLYTLKSFTRVNNVPKKDVDEFVTSVSGRLLSTRDIERLAWGYFKCPSFKEKIQNGEIPQVLKQLRSVPLVLEGDLDDFDRKTLWDLETLSNCMDRTKTALQKGEHPNPIFLGKAKVFSRGILERAPVFIKILEGILLK
jgi:hypothetical protein